MKLYKTKSKMLGYQIGLQDDHIYVAVAKKYFDGPGMDGIVEVECQGVRKKFIESDRVGLNVFKDKFHPTQNYTIYYFKWKD